MLLLLELLTAEPEGSLIVPREPAEPLDELPLVPWSLLPLQPTNNTAALAIANNFFIMVCFLPATVSPPRQLLNP